MITRKTFAERIGYLWTCVAPATLLSDECGSDELQSLRDVASRDGLCYVQVMRPLVEGSCYLARAAATPDLLFTSAFTIVLSEENLHLVLPYDCRLAGKSAEHVLTQLHAHATAVHASLPRQAATTLYEEAMAISPIAAPSPSDSPEADAVTPLPAIFVSQRHLSKVLQTAMPLSALSSHSHRQGGLWHRLHSWLIVALLHAALKATVHCQVLYDAIRQVLAQGPLARHAQLCLSEVCEAGRCVGWWLIIGAVPSQAVS